MESKARLLTLFRRLHIILGTLVSLPVLAWSLSGLLMSLPASAVGSQPFEMIDLTLLHLSPQQAMKKLENEIGQTVQSSSLSLEQRGGHPRYRIFAGGQNYLINGENGKIEKAPPPSRLTRWVRNAHFFNFAGGLRTPLLVAFSLLAALSSLSGIFLLTYAWARRF